MSEATFFRNPDRLGEWWFLCTACRCRHSIAAVRHGAIVEDFIPSLSSLHDGHYPYDFGGDE